MEAMSRKKMMPEAFTKINTTHQIKMNCEVLDNFFMNLSQERLLSGFLTC